VNRFDYDSKGFGDDWKRFNEDRWGFGDDTERFEDRRGLVMFRTGLTMIERC